ncbi:glutamate receptor ionotropic, kainate 2-like isoform X1 [Lineus longissimus]|uniref:glutamate receptor ionotropic, kainate 2-like isoform X1 n=1 Tax=Lineus longissimus TaxID=88925 RepID=UPI002B4ED832
MFKAMEEEAAPRTIVLTCLILGLVVAKAEAKCTFKIGVVEGLPAETIDWKKVISKAYQTFLTQDPGLTGFSVDVVSLPVSQGTNFEQLKKAHKLIESSAVNAIFGPVDPPLLSAAAEYNLPYISSEVTQSELHRDGNLLINLLPDVRAIVQVVNRISQVYKWENVAVIYDSEAGISLIETLVQRQDISVRAWKMNTTFQIEDIRRDLLDIRKAVLRVVIVVCEPNLTQSILGEALRFSMLSQRFFWLLPSLNPYHVDLSGIKNTGVQLAMFRSLRESSASKDQTIPKRKLLHWALASDSVKLLLNEFKKIGNGADCSTPDLVAGLKNADVEGDLGRITFHKDGTRATYQLDIMALTPDGLVQVGTWNSSTEEPYRLIIKRVEDWRNLTDIEFDLPFGKKLLKVVTIIEPPFVKLKDNSANRTGNDRFEGYCIDLLENIAAIHGFEYEIYLVPDGKFGAEQEKDGMWDGVIGELMTNRADMAVASLTINVQREQAVDFSKPFMNLGISILMKKPETEPSFFQFTEPLSVVVWVLVFVAFFVVSVVLFILDKICPAQDVNVRFDMKESLWFSYGALVQAGTETLPRTLCGRILTSSWWFFSLILISSYTANLAAFLTVSKINSPIKGVTDLVGQTKVNYGTVTNSQVMMFFKNSKIETFEKMWAVMGLMKENMVESSEEGIARVVNSTADYAFLWDSPVVKFQTTLKCDLMEVGHPFDSKGYGIGVPPGAPYRDHLTMAILKLNEEGVLQSLEDKWWRDSKCPDDSSSTASDHKELTLEMVAGVFFLLVAGVVVSVIVCFIEWWWRKRRSKMKPKKARKAEKVNSTTPFTPQKVIDADGNAPNKYYEWSQDNGPGKTSAVV